MDAHTGIETERFMLTSMEASRTAAIAFEDSIWGLKPVCQHLRVIPTTARFRGMLALAARNTPTVRLIRWAASRNRAYGSANRRLVEFRQAAGMGRSVAHSAVRKGQPPTRF